MNEKMTDEELSLILAHIRMELGHGAESDLSAHIATLTDERDAAAKREKTTRESIWETHLDMDNARCPGTNRPIEERIRLLWEERDEARKEREQFRADLVRMSEFAFQGGTGSPVTQEGNDALESIGGLWNKADALRERVTALEKVQGQYFARLQAAMDHLAAINQRAGDVDEMESVLLGGGLHALSRYIIGDDARPSAPPEAFTHEKGLDAGVFDEDPTPAEADLRCKHGLDTPSVCAVCQDDVEPTTSEAFATVREAVAIARDNVSTPTGILAMTTAEHALSLLERRMGAQQRALEETLKLHHRMPGDVIRMVQNALTDAPLVFTLEEVRAALLAYWGRNYFRLAVEAALERLTAMRK